MPKCGGALWPLSRRRREGSGHNAERASARLESISLPEQVLLLSFTAREVKFLRVANRS